MVATIEDLRTSLINSRKINVRSLVNFCIKTKEIEDEEILKVREEYHKIYEKLDEDVKKDRDFAI